MTSLNPQTPFYTALTAPVTPSLQMHKAYSLDLFIVDLDDVLEWLGNPRKSKIVDTLKKNFTETYDYLSLGRVKKSSPEYDRTHLGSGKNNIRSKKYRLTVRCFYHLAMISKTPQGALTRNYFLTK